VTRRSGNAPRGGRARRRGDLAVTAVEESAAAGVTASEFRQAIGHYATGVTVATPVGSDGQPIGTTASAVASLSLDPPLVLVCFDRASLTLGAVRAHGAFVVNVLAAPQQHLSANFARRGRLDLGLGRSGGRPPGQARPGRPQAAPPAGGTTAPNGLLIPPRFSLERLLASPRLALNKKLLMLPGAEPQNYTEQVDDVLALLGGSYRTRPPVDRRGPRSRRRPDRHPVRRLAQAGHRPAGAAAGRHRRRRADRHLDHPRPRRPGPLLPAAGRGVAAPVTNRGGRPAAAQESSAASACRARSSTAWPIAAASLPSVPMALAAYRTKTPSPMHASFHWAKAR
jgi:Flavin reductase like domain